MDSVCEKTMNLDLGRPRNQGRGSEQRPSIGLKEILLEERGCSAVIITQGKGKDAIEPPHTGMLFDSSDDLFVYYKSYGNQVGFHAMRKTSKRDDEGNIRFWTFACAQSGKSRLTGQNLVSPNYITKTGCNAKICASLYSDGRLRVNSVFLEHNHSLCPGRAKCSRRRWLKRGGHAKAMISCKPSNDTPKMQRYSELCSLASEINELAMGSEEKSKMAFEFYRDLKEKLSIINPPSMTKALIDMQKDPSPIEGDGRNNEDVENRTVSYSNGVQREIEEKKNKEEANGNSIKAVKCEAVDSVDLDSNHSNKYQESGLVPRVTPQEIVLEEIECLAVIKSEGEGIEAMDLDSNLTSEDREIELVPSIGPQEAVVEQIDCLAAIKSEGKDVIMPPHPGMLFDSVDDLFEYYKGYGNQEGFQIMKRTRKRDDDGNVRYWTFACARNGKSRSRKRNRINPNLITKTECSAKISASLYVDGRVRVNSVFLEHSHALGCGESRMDLAKLGN